MATCVLALVAASAAAVRHVGPRPLRLEVGAYDGLLAGDWSRSQRADIDPPAAADRITSFYYRAVSSHAGASLPMVLGEGPLRIGFRATARVRSSLAVFVSGAPAGEVLVSPGPWDRYDVRVPAGVLRDAGLDLAFALRPLPLVRGAHVEDPAVLVDALEVEAPGGLTFSARAVALVAAVPAVAFTFGLALGVRPWGATLLALAAAVASVTAFRVAPFASFLALPRLVPVAVLVGLAVHRLLAWAEPLPRLERAALAGLVTLGTLLHGSLVFLPNHCPPDIDIHVRRSLDLAGVPLDYQAILRYGSQLPTASQDLGHATAALGEKTLIPYSPLPYLFYYAAHVLGLDLYWAMTVLNAALAMAVVPLMWLVGRGLWGRGAGWLAALLYALDLAVWHHVGRSHAPAVFGGALGTAALLYLVSRAETLDAPRRIALAGVVLGGAVLGYSSLVVLFGLFGAVLLALLGLDARGLAPGARRGAALALVAGGILAGLLFYFHYLPGLLRGAGGVEAEPDLFPGRTFFIFHNESRQSYRIWVLGYWIPLLAGLAAAPFALRRAPGARRPFLLAWLAAWALLMLLKEPFLLPRLLRWAKEDQFLSPLLCLLVAGGVSALPRTWQRVGASAAAVATAAWLQLRDFWHHADSLRL